MVKLFARSCVVLLWGAISSSPRLPAFGVGFRAVVHSANYLDFCAFASWLCQMWNVHFSAARPVWNLISGEVCITIFLDQRRAFEWRIKSPGRPVEDYHGPWVRCVA
jgi:hypothetical protein